MARKKLLILLLILLDAILLNASLALAIDFGGSQDMAGGGFSGSMDPTSFMSGMMTNMGMNPTSMKDMFEQMNVYAEKKTVPTASIFISPSNPKEGDDVNANAMVKDFKNPKEGLYFTWFIKHDSNCPTDDGEDDDSSLCGYTDDAETDVRRCVKGNCDWDNDNDVTINDYKIEAIRLLAAKKFDSDFPDESYYTDDLTADGEDNHDDDEDNYDAIYGGEKSEQSEDSNDEPEIRMCYIHDYKSGKDYQVVDEGDVGEIHLDPNDPTPSNCFHLFPEDRAGNMLGEGDYDRNRERLFGTDHHRADTLGMGQKDGASVVGLGLDRITWEYKTGDKVGVIVEGNSMIPNKYYSSSMQIMWTFPEIDGCSITDLTDNQFPSPDMAEYQLPMDPLSAMVTDSLISYVASVDDDREGINDCLERSMKEVQQGGPELLDVALTATPENPMMEDTIRVTASVSNSSNDASQMKYVWTVSGKKENGDDFTEDDITPVGPLTGNGLSSISFKINSVDSDDEKPDGNIKVKVTISENYGSSTGEIQRGKGSVDVPVNTSGDRISVYRADVGSDGLLSLGDEICNEGKELSICPVLRNQIIGIRTENDSDVSNFYWTLDGTSLNCSSSMSSECSDESQNTVNFFPVAGNTGQKYTLLLTANNVGGDGENLNLTRIFQVVDPTVKIMSDGTSAWPRYLGEYTPLNAEDCVDDNDPSVDLCADYSRSIFETSAGSGVTLSAEYTPEWIEDDSGTAIEWIVDGVVSAQPSFTAGETGDVHSIGVNVTYIPSDDIRLALEKFGISGYNSTELVFSDSVQVEVVDDSSTTAMSNPKRIMASLASNLPSQIFFMLRIMLSVFVILLVSNIVFAFSPAQETEIKS